MMPRRVREARVSPHPSIAEVLGRPLSALPDPLELAPAPAGVVATVELPGSKSLTNRALLLAALADGESVVQRALLDADDARVMIEALRALGVGVDEGEDGELRIRGCAGRFRGGCSINLKNAGTATRFLTAAACLADGPVEIDGNARMRERPIGELVGMLRLLGVRLDELGAPGRVPLRVHPCRPEGGTMRVPTTLSSQFVSALMMVAPWCTKGLSIEFDGPVTSPSYIEMTAGLMREACGVAVKGSVEKGRIAVPASVVRGFAYTVEPDASGATYFAAGAALIPGARVMLPGLTRRTLQADAGFFDVLERCGGLVAREAQGSIAAHGGAVRAVEADLGQMPDTAMTLAAVACFAPGTTTIRGLRTLRVKETDRIAAIAAELGKLGVRVEVFAYTDASGAADEGVRITPPAGGIDLSAGVGPVEFETYDDHRMAMSLALIGLRRPNVWIRDPGCVAKTYPGFWADLSRLYAGVPRAPGIPGVPGLPGA